MTHPPPLARAALARPRFLAAAAAASLAAQAALVAILAPISGLEVLRIQTTFSREEFLGILAGWERAGVLDNYRRHFSVDMLYPAVYAVLLASFLAWALQRRGAPARWDRLLLLPPAAALCDVVENLLHLHILGGPGAVPAGLVAAAALAAWVKWLLVLGCALAGLVAAVGKRASPAP